MSAQCYNDKKRERNVKIREDRKETMKGVKLAEREREETRRGGERRGGGRASAEGSTRDVNGP
jgi:hypothetical protein